MERFRRYFERTLNVENVKNSDRLCVFGITCRYLPEPMEDFDELEFTTEFGSHAVLISIVVQSGKIKRIQFTLLDPENPDVVKGLTESQLKDLLTQKGDQLVDFFDYITQ